VCAEYLSSSPPLPCAGVVCTDSPVDVESDAYASTRFTGVVFGSGQLRHNGEFTKWHEVRGQKFNASDTMGLLLNCDAGSLAVYKNGFRLGLAVQSELHGGASSPHACT
jgi:hypothetical protein